MVQNAASTPKLTEYKTCTVGDMQAWRPKVGRAPWLGQRDEKGRLQRGTLLSAKPEDVSAKKTTSGGEWDVRIALSLIFLIIAVNVVLTVVLSSGSSSTDLAEPYNAPIVTGVADAKAASGTASSDSREELLSIISKH